jgi:pseudaminic acid biosynthesis-associated methylase
MTTHSKTEQEEFWRGEFGDSYSNRNAFTPEEMNARTRMWSGFLNHLDGDPPSSILEIGANIGLNLRALPHVCQAELFALEPNMYARDILTRDEVVKPENIIDGAAQSIPLPDNSIDLVFTTGVLIHVAPETLAEACAEIVRVAKKYVICSEYFSDKDEEILYRGHVGKLFKRDFGGFYLDQHPELTLVDYGFLWKRITGLDNTTWWIFRK